MLTLSVSVYVMQSMLCLLLIPFSILSCNPDKKDNTLSFNRATIRQFKPNSSSSLQKGWAVTNGIALIDSTTVYGKDNLYTLRFTPSIGDTSKIHQVFYLLDTRHVEGDSISFSGSFKSFSKDSLSISFGIQQLVFLYTRGEGTTWTSNWQVSIDKKSLDKVIEESLSERSEDTEFDKASLVSLPSLTPQMVENLEVLGKVWGFLKYYHPEVARGKYNWDYELFRISPQVTNAKNKEERNVILNQWIDKIGKVDEIEVFVIDDPKQYSRIIDLNWLNDVTIFNQELIDKLYAIKNGKRSMKYNHYVLSPSYGQNGSENDVEANYANITWQDQGYRILTLFKLWNAVEYCATYVELTDKLWRSLLKAYIQSFVEAESKIEYELSLVKLFVNVDESHG